MQSENGCERDLLLVVRTSIVVVGGLSLACIFLSQSLGAANEEAKRWRAEWSACAKIDQKPI